MNLKQELEKEILVCNNDGFTLFKLSNKRIGMLYGLLAYMLLFTGAATILQTPYLSILKILFAVIICLPISYLQMEKHRAIECYIRGN